MSLYNHIAGVTSQLVGPAEDILEYNAIGRLGFSPRIRGHVYYAPGKFDSIHSARQWARANNHRNRPISCACGGSCTEHRRPEPRTPGPNFRDLCLCLGLFLCLSVYFRDTLRERWANRRSPL
jgi:hypothetical protein